MNNKWNRNSALWMLLYAVLYAVATAVVCVMTVSSCWAFVVVFAAGIIVCLLLTNVYMNKLAGIDK